MEIITIKNVLYYPNEYCNNMIENRVAIYMAIKRLDKRDIVRMTGIDRHTLNNICKCKTKGIEFETLNKLCFALDCTLNDLFRYVPDENPPV
ncbi:MAG: helix-turn-helix transcriptional regulator [Brachyspira sp.]|jgi:hypothetical protein|nr:helix-turn-helix transcriptional regulator [Brachyspira sp.]